MRKFFLFFFEDKLRYISLEYIQVHFVYLICTGIDILP